MTTSFADHLLTGDHASRPSAASVPEGTKYACTDHSIIYSSDGASWTDWHDPTGLTPAFVGSRVYNSANISIVTSGTPQALTFNSERFDSDAFHDTGSNTGRLTVPTGKAGKYEIGGHIEFAGNATGYRMALIRLNGSTYIAREHTRPASTETVGLSVVTLYDLAEADYVELVALQSSGGALNVNVAGNYSPEFWLQRVG